MKGLLLLFIITCSTLAAQTIDHNLKKGFAANGYDVVSYFDNTPLKGHKKHIAIFNGISYTFSSDKNLQKFNKNPNTYIPQYGGYCAYAIAVKSEKASINPETFLIKDGKLYLFYNSWGTNTLKLWEQNKEQKLREMADVNWEKIKYKK